jgi:hypothetical protein
MIYAPIDLNLFRLLVCTLLGTEINVGERKLLKLLKCKFSAQLTNLIVIKALQGPAVVIKNASSQCHTCSQ